MSKQGIQPIPGMAYEHRDGDVWLVKSIGDVIHLADFAGGAELHINRDAFDGEFTPMGVVESHQVDEKRFVQVAQNFDGGEDTYVTTLFAVEDGEAYPWPMTGGAFACDSSTFERRFKAHLRAVLTMGSVEDAVVRKTLDEFTFEHVEEQPDA